MIMMGKTLATSIRESVKQSVSGGGASGSGYGTVKVHTGGSKSVGFGMQIVWDLLCHGQQIADTSLLPPQSNMTVVASRSVMIAKLTAKHRGHRSFFLPFGGGIPACTPRVFAPFRALPPFLLISPTTTYFS